MCSFNRSIRVQNCNVRLTTYKPETLTWNQDFELVIYLPLRHSLRVVKWLPALDSVISTLKDYNKIKLNVEACVNLEKTTSRYKAFYIKFKC